jgi:cyanate lyase
MSAVNFRVNIERRPHPGGDRVVITFDGKFLDDVWDHTAQADLV